MGTHTAALDSTLTYNNKRIQILATILHIIIAEISDKT